MSVNPLAAYKETRVRTASPGQLVVMLYTEAVKQCGIAAELMEEDLKKRPDNIERINKALCKVQDIITELMASLDFDAGGEIAQNLFSLYSFFNREILDANIKKEPARIRAVRTMLDDLRAAWAEAANKVQSQGSGASVGVNIAG